MNKKLYIAPLQGFTEAPFCHFHAEIYGGADAYFTPFMRVEKGAVRPRDIRNITSPLCGNHTVVPQIIFKDAAEFMQLHDAVRDAGYNRMDLNLGCPFRPQVLHGRGAALTGKPELLSEIAVLCSGDVDVSVKMRLGVERPDEWRGIIDVLNRMPLHHVTVHPRVAAQQYSGELHLEEFGRFLSECHHPVVFNGDLCSAADIESAFSHYPSLHGVMLGRGVLARPSLAAEWREGREWPVGERMEKLRRLHEGIYGYYAGALCGDSQILSKMKPFWEYMEGEIGRKPWKAIKKASTIPRYEEAVRFVFR